MSNEVSKRCILHVDDTNKVSSYKRNNYAMQSLLAISGGAVEKLNTCLDSYRVGGSTTDKYNYINGYVDNSTVRKEDIRVSAQSVSPRAFDVKSTSDRGHMLHFNALRKLMRVKFDRYSGCIYKTAGLKKKVDVARHSLQYFEKVILD